ncbi:glycosyltransferase family 22 protein [Laccaria amethystina LaAM-08-1]|uniref:Mannosyltransferase n=1 Tax=Laccaria amethystina LaAM-08-1 TaxID=1095629 RepID=A0A0C9WKQ9_9AGAR|nr:glycosyltransferase family 22 protein [Laccaria amethystina LaAM-08-1]
MSTAQDLLILLTAWTHVFLAPYTKVEESFNLHATHDVLFYGVFPDALHKYDHFTFPGAVPRTFIGSILLAWLSTPVIWLLTLVRVDPTKFELQIIIRLVLSTVTALSLCLLRRAVSRRFGYRTSLFFTLLTCSQFHLPFWMGRTVSNMFAFGPVTIALALLIPPSPKSKKPSPLSTSTAFTLLTLSAVIFRAELLLLLAPLALHSLLARHITFGRLVRVGLRAGVVSIGLTVLIDTYFWKNKHTKYPLWPELFGVYFNVVQGKSADWGTSPPQTYLTTHLPKLLLSSLPLALLALLTDARIRSLLWPTMVFIGIMSMLGHKEWRFIVYVVPLWNVAGARGCVWMYVVFFFFFDLGLLCALFELFLSMRVSFLERLSSLFIRVFPAIPLSSPPLPSLPTKSQKNSLLILMVSRRKGTLLGRLSFLLVRLLILTNILITVLLTTASMANYPGGHALALLHSLYPRARHTTTITKQAPHIHISNLAAQTGASLFLQINSLPDMPPAFLLSSPSSSSFSPSSEHNWWTYNKTENLSLKYLTSQQGGFTHLITESALDTDTTTVSEWKLLGIIRGFERWLVDWELLTSKGKGKLLRRHWGVLKMVQVEKLWVYEWVGWGSLDGVGLVT